MISINIEHPEIGPQINDLLQHAFGNKRNTLPSIKFRRGSRAIPNLCFVAMDSGRLVGVIRFTKIVAGSEKAAILLGPIAVHGDYRGLNIGSSLMKHGLGASKDSGYKLVIAIGDPGFLGRFGFVPAVAGGLSFPVLVDQNRFLMRELELGSSKNVNGNIKLA